MSAGASRLHPESSAVQMEVGIHNLSHEQSLKNKPKELQGIQGREEGGGRLKGVKSQRRQIWASLARRIEKSLRAQVSDSRMEAGALIAVQREGSQDWRSAQGL